MKKYKLSVSSDDIEILDEALGLAYDTYSIEGKDEELIDLHRVMVMIIEQMKEQDKK